MKQLKNHILHFLILVIGISLTHCASSTDIQGDYSSILKFYSGGNEYTIMSFLSTDAIGYNVLMREENNKVIIKGIDKQQDGELDEVQEGDISLADANKIYADGLAAAKEMGMLKQRDFERYYNFSDKIYDYEIRTYILAHGDNYNLFAARKKIGNNVIIMMDEKADGLLDNFQEGSGDIIKFQALYEEVLRQGIINHRVVNADKIYLVTN
ncbi:MAG: hypothetical protein WBG58_17995 [Ignavibacteriaceae bacterium]|jgi:hypothetical protein